MWVWESAASGPGSAARGANLAKVRGGGYTHTFREIHTQARALAFSHSLAIAPPLQCPDSALDYPSPHRRGCLFLLGLSMLSLFKRLCHRLDAGNKVRRCV